MVGLSFALARFNDIVVAKCMVVIACSCQSQYSKCIANATDELWPYELSATTRSSIEIGKKCPHGSFWVPFVEQDQRTLDLFL